MIEFTGKYTNATVMIDEIDNVTAGQIVEFINNEVFTNPIAIMPDTHAGKGAVIGFTMEMTDKVIPNVVGVDISCGMITCQLGKQVMGLMRKDQLDREIRKVIPFGTNVRQQVSDQFDIGYLVHKCNMKLVELRKSYYKKQCFQDLKNKCKSVGIDDNDTIIKVYENAFQGCSHKLSDDVISCLERIN